MEQNITTFNTDELITSYIDNQIKDPGLKKQIEELLEKDHRVRKKYESELLTKNYLKNRLSQQELPEYLYNRIYASINTLSTTDPVSQKAVYEYPSFISHLGSVFSRKLFGVPAYMYASFIFLMIVVISFLTIGGRKELNPYITSGSDKSIMVQAVKNFHKVLKGEVKPQYTSSNAAEVENYVNENAKFKPHIPQIREYILAGVICNEYKGQKLAHIIYRNQRDEIFYIYQTPIKSILNKELELPEPVHREISETKYYICDRVDENECTMTLWFRNDVICASLSTMDKEDMEVTYTNFIK